MTIDGTKRIVWPKPREGRYLVRIRAQDQRDIEETDWALNVLKPEIPGLVVHATRHMDYVVPPAYAEWMTRSGADRIVDAYYEFGRDLVGGLPSDIRQSMVYTPSMGGAHSGDPIVSGPSTFGDDDANRWRLGYLFHELGHDLNAWTRVGTIEHGDAVADDTLHDMVEFDKIAWVMRILKAPEAPGVVDVPRFAEWMKAESNEFVDSLDRYLAYVQGGGDFLHARDRSGPWAGMIHRYAFRHGGAAFERCVRAIRRDGIPLMAYPQDARATSDRLTIVMCVMSNAVGADLRGEFRAAGMPLNPVLYDRFYPTVARQMADLPPVGRNGAFRCGVDGHYYCLTPYGTTWAVAEATARRLGGHLATIRSAAQEAWLANKFGPDGWLWVGYRREGPEGRWRWVTGETTESPIREPERPETDPAKTGGVLILHEDAGREPWSGLANRPPDEDRFGIVELDHPPALDVDALP